MFPARFAPVLFGFLVSGLMSFIVTGIATVKSVGFGPSTVTNWMESWAFSWPVAFIVILFVAPLARKLVARMVRED